MTTWEPERRLRITRVLLLSLYTMIFAACFANVGLSLYYLSALALDSFQTSSAFSGILISGSALLVASVWGCHRTKDVRSHSKAVSRVAFTTTFLAFLGVYILWAVRTRQTYDLIVETIEQPLSYWAVHPGAESRLLYNFAREFEEMWLAGVCGGNECIDPACVGDPVLTTPLVCADEGMQAQFRQVISQYDGTAAQLRECISLVEAVKQEEDDKDLPVVTWCQARVNFLTDAEKTNEAMFWVVLVQSVLIFLSIAGMYYYMTLVRAVRPEAIRRPMWIRSRLSDSKWLSSLRSDDEELDAFKKRQLERNQSPDLPSNSIPVP